MISSIKNTAAKGYLKAFSAAALSTVIAGYSPLSTAGATFKIDDTKWLSIGAGFRTSFTAMESGAPNGDDWSNSFALNNMRLYLNAQLHEYIKLTFNTEISNNDEIRVLDAIGQFEIMPEFNVWVGRMLVPAERRELNGPFYSAVWPIFSAGTPFEPSDFGTSIGSGTAGAVGRDDGATVWGSFMEGRLQYAVGFFRGLRASANQEDNILFAQRIAYNFLDVEKNPGYYTSGTYYGGGGDIFTIGLSHQYQEDGAGTAADAGDFQGFTVDVLYETVLGNEGVVTINGEYKNYEISNGYSTATRDSLMPGFNMFEGDAYDVSGMYLIPGKVLIGQFQPYLRYVNVMPDTSADRDVYEAGVNYIIDGHNARISLAWQYGDLMTKGLDYSSDATGDDVHAITLGLQLQI